MENGEKKVLKGKALKIVEKAIKTVVEKEPEVKNKENFKKFIKETKVWTESGEKNLQEHLGL